MLLKLEELNTFSWGSMKEVRVCRADKEEGISGWGNNGGTYSETADSLVTGKQIMKVADNDETKVAHGRS